MASNKNKKPNAVPSVLDRLSEQLPSDNSNATQGRTTIDYLEELVVTAIGVAQIDVDGKPDTQAKAVSGATIRAGKSTFRIHQSDSSTTRAISDVKPTKILVNTSPVWEKRSEHIEWAGLSDEAKSGIHSAKTPVMAVEQLQGQGRLEDAIRLIASALLAGARIHWCEQALKFAKVGIESKASEAVSAWLAQQSEEARQSVETMVPWNDKSSPWTWCMTAIAWTGGSMAPSDSAPIPPPPRMVIAAVIAAMQLASSRTNSSEFRVRCIEEGLARLRESQ